MFDNTKKTPRPVWRSLICVAFGLMTAMSAYAADPVNGKALYLGRLGTRGNTCSSCHNADPSRNISKVKNGANAPTVISSAISSNVGGMNEFVGKFTSAEVADIAAFIGNPKLTGLSGTVAVAPASLTFASQAVNTAATAQTVTVSNTSTTSTVTLSGLTIGGTNSADFSQTGGTCTATTTLAASGSCTVVVGFTPKASGARAGTLTIASNATNPSVALALSGTGAAPVAGVSPTTLTYASTSVGATSAAQTVTVSNTGSSALVLSTITLGGSLPGDYAISSSGTCAAGGSVAAGSSCTVLVTFKPTATGARAATLNIAHNATGSPSAVTLNGTASAAPQALLQVDQSSLAFASQPVTTTSTAKTITLTNTGSASMSLTGYSVGGAQASDFITGGTCNPGGALAVNATCTITVSYKPLAVGSSSGTLTIASNASNPSLAVNLSGTSTALVGTLSASSTSVAFGSQAINTATLTQTVTLSNTGNGATTFTSFTAGGTHAADFSKTGGTCAVATPLAAGGSCTLILGFRPTATGVRAGTLTVASNATNASLVITLGGTGTAAVASVSPASVGFGSALVGNTSAAQTITLSNSGTAALSITSLTSSAASEFKISGGTCTSGGTVAINGSCTVIMDFTPLSNGARTATLSIAHSATGSPTTVALSGTGTVATPAIQVSPSALSWAQTVATTSVAQTVTITNTGTGALTLQTIAFGGTSAAEYTKATSSTCAAGGSVAVGGSCDIQITFRPTAVGARSANLNITHNAAGSPSSVALNGSGTAAPQGLLQVDQTSLTFAAQALTTTSTAQVVTLKNTGAASMTLSDVAISGTQAADFTTAGTCNKGGALAVNATCTVTVNYSPKAIGSSTASLTLTTTGSNPTVVIGLGGTATAAPAPVLSLSPNSLSFASVQLGNTSSAQTITLSNTGTANMSLSGIVSNGTVFAQTNTCPTTLAPAGSCQISVSFTPSAVGNASGTLTITSNAAGSPQSLALTGVGAAVPLPQASWSATSVNFASTVTVGSVSSQTLTLSNAGPGALTVQTLAVQGANTTDFSVTYTSCGTSLPFSLAANASCQIDVTFSPNAAGARTATLGIVHTGQGAASLALSGQGATATVTPTPAPAPTGTTTPAATKSAGAGGCSIGQPDQPTDPIWALLCFGALGVMWWRRRTASV